MENILRVFEVLIKKKKLDLIFNTQSEFLMEKLREKIIL